MSHQGFRCLAVTALLVVSLISHHSRASSLDDLFNDQKLGSNDAILITKSAKDAESIRGNEPVVFAWQADKLLVPASTAKLAVAQVAIEQWGLEKRFVTDFYRHESTLWVKGYGDPFLVSEELDLVVKYLQDKGLAWVESIAIDASYFYDQRTPGRSSVADPYNAPLSAVAANFNTAKLRNENGHYTSAEPQTPITRTAVHVAKRLGIPGEGKAERVNLINAENARRYFAELLAAKLKLSEVELVLNQKSVPSSAITFYQHKNSHNLADIIRGTLEFSNNFMANQLFLMLAAKPKASFEDAAKVVEEALKKRFSWSEFNLVEGSGLSRANRLSAVQLDNLLTVLAPHKSLFKAYKTKIEGATVRAKTGTLNGVHSFAGYISIDGQEYQFVFNFNRTVPYRYRETLLHKLVSQLATAQRNNKP